MQLSRVVAGIGVIILMTNVAFGRKVRTDYDKNADFSKYRTFVWIQAPNTNNPFMQERLMSAINEQMSARGFEPVTSDADVTISATFTTQEEQTVNTYYTGSWGWGGGWATTTVDSREIGTLVVDLADAETGKALWRGTAVHSVSSKPEKASKKFQKEIREMFEEFPFVCAANRR